ncbi:MAG: DUF4147 domain-containing protein, partial [Planctomycetota bacterium]
MNARLRAYFDRTVRELDPSASVHAALQSRRDELATVDSVLVIAIGKAARKMATAALRALGMFANKATVRGLCVPPEPDSAALSPLTVIPGGHPWPSEGSFLAARTALELCRSADARTFVLFLVSGGASSLCELPLDESIQVPAWREFYRALVGSGAGIESINTVRKFVS